MKPVIGLIPLWDDEKESLWMLPGYMDGVIAAGGLPLMLPLTDNPEMLKQACGMCSGFLLTGGHDVSPSVYHAGDPRGVCGVCPARDSMERIVLEFALGQDKPVLGICRGIQFLNAALGGTLYQDLPTEHSTGIDHHQHPPYDIPQHHNRIFADTPLFQLLQKDEIAVNSYHHQAVLDLSPLLKPMAESEDGLTEAVWMPGKRFVWGVQWHPEFAFRTDSDSMKIFQAFTDACIK